MSSHHLPPLLVGALLFTGCAEQSQAAPPQTADEPDVVVLDGPAPTVGSSSGQAKPRPSEHIQPGQVVPAFRLTTVDGETIDSADVIGKKPFVVLFFASWCGVCEQKLPVVQQALDEEGGELLVLGTVLDEPETWDAVEPYLERHGLSVTLVRGQEHRGFFRAYDPFGSVPLVMVINQKGVIVDLQRGASPGDGERFREALRLVRDTST